MSKPIIVGYDPATVRPRPGQLRCRRRALHRGAAHRRLGLSAAGDRPDAGHQDEDLVIDPSDALAEASASSSRRGSRSSAARCANTSAARALHETSEAEDAGLLVVGSTRRGSVGRVLPGSTADRLMHGAPCPIAIVPPGWEAGARAQHDRRRLRRHRRGPRGAARRYALARRAGATLRVLTAVKAGLAMYGETEARTAEQRGKDFDEVEGRAAGAGRERAPARDRRARRRRPGGDRRLRRGSRRRPDPRLRAPRPAHLRLARLRSAARGAARRRVAPPDRRGAVPGDRAAARREPSLEALMEASPGAAAR